MDYPIVIDQLRHSYGKRLIYEDLSLRFEPGKVYGLLGKNGVGKTTLIKLLMGFLKPTGGRCAIFGDPAHAISPATRARVGLLFERHLAYDFFSIEQIEKFHARFYPRWRRERFYNMADRLRLPLSHRIGRMSEGQRSQIVLGLLLAQDPELLILDDYSMGLDAGYRRLFVDYLMEHLKDGRHTIVLTSHVIQDMEKLVDEAIFLERGGHALRTSMADFMRTFRCYRLPRTEGQKAPERGGRIKNVEEYAGHWDIFSFQEQRELLDELRRQGMPGATLEEVPMSLEDAFVGYTGRY